MLRACCQATSLVLNTPAKQAQQSVCCLASKEPATTPTAGGCPGCACLTHPARMRRQPPTARHAGQVKNASHKPTRAGCCCKQDTRTCVQEQCCSLLSGVCLCRITLRQTSQESLTTAWGAEWWVSA